MLNQRKPNRLKDYDYSAAGCYFVTICTDDRVCFFGEIENTEMKLSNCGKIVESQMVWLQEKYEQVILEKTVIMPNHIHLLLTISYPLGNGLDRSLQKQKSLSSLIGAFKTTCSKLIHQSTNPDFKWQKSFYDHIIRSEREYENIWNYIHYNPLKWQWDAENKENSQPDKKYYEKLFDK